MTIFLLKAYVKGKIIFFKMASKRFRSVKKDIKNAIEVLLENPELGVEIQGGSGVRKVRVKNRI